MNQLADFHAEDFTAATASGFGSIHHSGLDCAGDCPSEWAVDSDEVGNFVYCEAAISDLLQRDDF